jgi:hypothetical protein
MDKQMNNINQSVCETEGPQSDARNETIRMVKFVEANDPAVKLGLERIGRLMQILRLPLDQVETALIQGKMRPNQSIKIIELAKIFQDRLGLNEN